MPKDYAIIIDDNDEYVVLPYKWLNNATKEYCWPKQKDDPIKLIIDNVDAGDDWDSYPFSKYIKSAGDFNFI